jgi:hypothetical protein
MVWSNANCRRLLGSLICSVWAVSAPVSAAEPPTVQAQVQAQPEAQPEAQPQAPTTPPKLKPVKKSAKSAGTPTRYLPNRFAGRAGMYYKSVWGVDMLSVKLTESGQIVRFTWRVLDPAKAKPLSDKVAQPSLVDPQAGVSLVVPTLENIGMMRQASAPEEGKSYWMAFSNKGRVVKKGDRVNVVIGQFRADGLAVDD